MLVYSAIAVLFLLYLLFNFYFFPRSFRKLGQMHNKVLDLTFGYGVFDVRLLFDSIKEEGRLHYKKVLWTLDFIYPVVYTLLLSLLFHALLPNFKNFEWLRFFPFIIMFLDYWENTNTTIMINRYPQLSETHVKLSSWITRLKWIFAGINVLALVILIAIVLLK